MAASNRSGLVPIGMVAKQLGLRQHMLRYWESKFEELNPIIRDDRRMYDTDSIRLIAGLKLLLHDNGKTMRAAQQLLSTKGADHVAGLADEGIEGLFPDLAIEMEAADDMPHRDDDEPPTDDEDQGWNLWEKLQGGTQSVSGHVTLSIGGQEYRIARKTLNDIDPDILKQLIVLRNRLNSKIASIGIQV